MKEIALQVINNYGIENQQRKLNEEVFELQEAIIKAPYHIGIFPEDYKHVVEELADVRFMLLQIQCWYEIKDEEIEEVMLFKGNRQLGRMKNEKEN